MTPRTGKVSLLGTTGTNELSLKSVQRYSGCKLVSAWLLFLAFSLFFWLVVFKLAQIFNETVVRYFIR